MGFQVSLLVQSTFLTDFRISKKKGGTVKGEEGICSSILGFKWFYSLNWEQNLVLKIENNEIPTCFITEITYDRAIFFPKKYSVSKI